MEGTELAVSLLPFAGVDDPDRTWRSGDEPIDPSPKRKAPSLDMLTRNLVRKHSALQTPAQIRALAQQKDLPTRHLLARLVIARKAKSVAGALALVLAAAARTEGFAARLGLRAEDKGQTPGAPVAA